MKIKVEYRPSRDERFIAGHAVVILGDRVMSRYAIYRGNSYCLQNSIDKATANAVDAAVQLSNERGIDFTIYDVDHSGLKAIECQVA